MSVAGVEEENTAITFGGTNHSAIFDCATSEGCFYCFRPFVNSFIERLIIGRLYILLEIC